MKGLNKSNDDANWWNLREKNKRKCTLRKRACSIFLVSLQISCCIWSTYPYVGYILSMIVYPPNVSHVSQVTGHLSFILCEDKPAFIAWWMHQRVMEKHTSLMWRYTRMWKRKCLYGEIPKHVGKEMLSAISFLQRIYLVGDQIARRLRLGFMVMAQ